VFIGNEHIQGHPNLVQIAKALDLAGTAS